MNTIIIDKSQESVTTKSERLHTRTQTIPLRLVDMLIITQSVSLEPKTVLELTRREIPLLYLSKDGRQMALTLPARAKNSDLKIAQYKATQRSVPLAKLLLKEKFRSHAAQLETHGIVIDTTEDLSALALAKSTQEILGIEGHFAKRYFSRYFGLFERKLTRGYRSKNPPQDPVNALLSFVYTICYHSLAAKLYMRGFDPGISYLHTPFRDHFALASDLMEPLRAQINGFVAEEFLQRRLGMQDFSLKRGVYLKYNSRRELWKRLKPFMDGLNKTANNQIAQLKKEILSSDEATSE